MAVYLVPPITRFRRLLRGAWFSFPVSSLTALCARKAVPPLQGSLRQSTAPLPSGLVQPFSFQVSGFKFQVSSFALSALLRSIRPYSLILAWRPLRPLREKISFNQPTENSEVPIFHLSPL
ncbi:MAG: hypothetical protein WAN16_11285, partial [Chthoniobacterales bacterium]